MKRIVLLSTLLLIGLRSEAQLDSVLTKLKDHGFGLRKTFDGSSKDEQKPASFFFFHDFKKKADYATIDVGAKLAELELNPYGSSALILVPKLEYHLSTQDSVEKNIFSAGANVEFIPLGGWAVDPFFIFSGDYQNDNKIDLETIKLKGFVSFTGTSGIAPGASIRNGDSAIVFRWYPYTGYEKFISNTKENLSSDYWATRLFFEWWPFPVHDKTFVQLTFDYTYRVSLDDELVGKDDIEWLSLGLNYYPDGNGKLGIGVDYSSGDDATTDFQFARRISLALKLKI